MIAWGVRADPSELLDQGMLLPDNVDLGGTREEVQVQIAKLRGGRVKPDRGIDGRADAMRLCA